MTTLNVTRALISRTNPTESQFDTMRTELLTFFNTTLMDENNLATGGLLYTSLDNSMADNALFSWTGDDALMKYDSSNDKFVIQNTEGNVFWGLKSGSTVTRYMELESSTGNLVLKGALTFNTAKGSQAVDLMWLLARYRKPRLVYSTDDIVAVNGNYSDGETYIMGRDRLWKVYDTTCSLAVNANGETSGDTGTAVSGLAQGLTRTANRWYYIYAVEVQYGTQADGVNCILVAHTTSPLSANITTLNTAFGTGKWIYMGVIRNGYNDGSFTNIIVKFQYDENGYCFFTNGTVTNAGRGVTMTSSTADVNLEWTVDNTNNDADSIPQTATRCVMSGYRSEYGFEFHYREVASSENHAVNTSCYHPASTPSLTATAILDVPVLTGYKFVVVIGNTTTNNRIMLTGFMDHYL